MNAPPVPPPYSTRVVDALRLPDGFTEADVVAVEEPLEIRIGGEPVAVTMRTPLELVQKAAVPAARFSGCATGE